MFSRLRIEFNTVFTADFTLKIATLLDGVVSSNTWTFKASRVAPFEVTVGGTTTTTAENFKTAYDLDLTTGYTTATDTGTITIDSTTTGLDFVGVACENDLLIPLTDGVEYTATFSNYVEPFDISTVDRILARSPHYINTPFYLTTTTGATIDLKIYSGHFTNDEPSEVTQRITKIRPTVDFAEFNTNIADTVRNALSGLPNINLGGLAELRDSNTNEVKWVKWTASYTNTIEATTDIEGFAGASDGYDYFLSGVNPSFSRVLTNSIKRKTYNQGLIFIPFVNDGEITTIDVTSSPNNNDPVTLTPTTTEESTDFVQYVQVDISDYSSEDNVNVLFSGAFGNISLDFDLISDCRYPIKQIVFKNQYGFYDVVTMFAKSVETLNTEREEFVNNYVENGTYQTTTHQNKPININATKSITCNSGFIKESENALYEELMLSEYVWFYENGQLIPIKVSNNEFTYKTLINDGLIEYNINFDYAYQYMNNI